MKIIIQFHRKEAKEFLTDYVLEIDDSRLTNLALELSKSHAHIDGLHCCPSTIDPAITYGLYSKDVPSCSNLLSRILDISHDNDHLKMIVLKCDFISLVLPPEYHEYLLDLKHESEDIYISLGYLKELFDAILKGKNFTESPMTDSELKLMTEDVSKTLKQIEDGSSKIKSLIINGKKLYN